MDPHVLRTAVAAVGQTQLTEAVESKDVLLLQRLVSSPSRQDETMQLAKKKLEAWQPVYRQQVLDLESAVAEKNVAWLKELVGNWPFARSGSDFWKAQNMVSRWQGRHDCHVDWLKRAVEEGRMEDLEKLLHGWMWSRRDDTFRSASTTLERWKTQHEHLRAALEGRNFALLRRTMDRWEGREDAAFEEGRREWDAFSEECSRAMQEQHFAELEQLLGLWRPGRSATAEPCVQQWSAQLTAWRPKYTELRSALRQALADEDTTPNDLQPLLDTWPFSRRDPIWLAGRQRLTELLEACAGKCQEAINARHFSLLEGLVTSADCDEGHLQAAKDQFAEWREERDCWRRCADSAAATKNVPTLVQCLDGWPFAPGSDSSYVEVEQQCAAWQQEVMEHCRRFNKAIEAKDVLGLQQALDSWPFATDFSDGYRQAACQLEAWQPEHAQRHRHLREAIEEKDMPKLQQGLESWPFASSDDYFKKASEQHMAWQPQYMRCCQGLGMAIQEKHMPKLQQGLEDWPFARVSDECYQQAAGQHAAWQHDYAQRCKALSEAIGARDVLTLQSKLDSWTFARETDETYQQAAEQCAAWLPEYRQLCQTLARAIETKDVLSLKRLIDNWPFARVLDTDYSQATEQCSTWLAERARLCDELQEAVETRNMPGLQQGLNAWPFTTDRDEDYREASQQCTAWQPEYAQRCQDISDALAVRDMQKLQRCLDDWPFARGPDRSYQLAVEQQAAWMPDYEQRCRDLAAAIVTKRVPALLRGLEAWPYVRCGDENYDQAEKQAAAWQPEYRQRCQDLNHANKSKDVVELQQGIQAWPFAREGDSVYEEAVQQHAALQLGHLQELLPTFRAEAQLLMRGLLDLQEDVAHLGLEVAHLQSAREQCQEVLSREVGHGLSPLGKEASLGHGKACAGETPLHHLGGFPALENWDNRAAFFASTTQYWGLLTTTVDKLWPTVEQLKAALRAEADRQDLKVIHQAYWQRCVSAVTHVAPAGAEVLQVPDDCPLRPGDQIIIGEEWNRVKHLGSIYLVARLSRPVELGVQVYRLEVAPVMPAKGGDDGKTQAFIDEVENFDSETQWSTDEVLAHFSHGPLPTDPRKRKEKLVNIYTGGELYGALNKAMYTNDREELRKYASYIRELRDVFQYGQDAPIVERFSGDVVRGLKLEDHQIASYAARLSLGQTLCWPSFTSTSVGSEVKAAFNQNTVLKVSCFRQGELKSGDYFPAKICQYSQYEDEDEVLFPPHCSLRFVNIKHVPASSDGQAKTVIEMETCGYPSLWDLVEKEDWTSFEHWADANSESIDCRQREHSIICAVAKSISQSPGEGDPDPFEVCLKHGANVNEVDPKLLVTALTIVAKKHTESKRSPTGLEGVIDSLLLRGASPYLRTPKRPAAVDFLGSDGMPDHRLMKFQWQYWVDDGVDQKATGWYVYEEDASDAVEAQFQQWLLAKCSDFTTVRNVQSGRYQYDVFFGVMHQVNTKTQKQRRIRRSALHSAKNADLEVEALKLAHSLDRVVCSALQDSAHEVRDAVPESGPLKPVEQLLAQLLSATRPEDALALAAQLADTARPPGGGNSTSQRLNLALEDLEQVQVAARPVATGACRHPMESQHLCEASEQLLLEPLSRAEAALQTADAAMTMALCFEVRARGGRTNAGRHWCLSWSNQLGTKTDLDLSTVCPNCKERVSWRRRTCNCSKLELDTDDRGRTDAGRSVENIFVLGMEDGTYDVRVHLFRGPPVPYLLSVRSFGKLQQLFRMEKHDKVNDIVCFRMQWKGEEMQLLKRWNSQATGPAVSKDMPLALAPPIGYSTTVGYVAVDAPEAIAAVSAGCKSSEICLGFCPRQCARALLDKVGGCRAAPRDIVVLELHNLPEYLLDRPSRSFAQPKIDPQHLRLGTVELHGLALDRKEDGKAYLEAPCPYCKGAVSRTGELDGMVGLWRFWDDAFMTSRCPKPQCIQRMRERQQRLSEGKVLHLYHQTTPAIAAAIKTSGKMIRGSGGIVGGGVYLAESPRETEWKWEAFKGTQWGKEDGVVLECAVSVGRVREIDRGSEDPRITFASMVECGEYDSVHVDRGICQVEGPAFGKPSGNEIIVYSWDQVSVLREVPRDPVPPNG